MYTSLSKVHYWQQRWGGKKLRISQNSRIRGFQFNPCAPNGKCPKIAKWSLKLSLKVGDDNSGMSQLSSRVSLVVCEFHGVSGLGPARPCTAAREQPAGEAGRPVPPGRHGTVRSCNPQSPLGSCSDTTCELMRQANTPQQQQLDPPTKQSNPL